MNAKQRLVSGWLPVNIDLPDLLKSQIAHRMACHQANEIRNLSPGEAMKPHERWRVVVAAGFAYAGFLSNVAANVHADETILRAHFLCVRVYAEPDKIIYERDKSDQSKAHAQLMRELAKKYSRSDSDTMIAKTILEAERLQARGDPVSVCRNTYSMLEKQRAEFGAILSRD